ncbi:MAG: EamA family transporter RarD [Croceibacterium sp.]
MTTPTSPQKSGLPFALGAHAVWGSMPLYLQLVHQVPALEYVAWRIIFTLPLCLAALAWQGSWGELRAILRNPRTVLTLLASAALIGINWFLYVWAIASGHVYAASLGYYILPLAMMLLGMVVLGETLTRRQWGAVALAGIGVTALAIGALTTLWVSLSMAVTFGLYGLLRKTVAAGPLTGLTVESLLLLLPAAGVAVWYAASPQGSSFGRDAVETAAIVGGGPMTAVPLIWFAIAARRMPYTVIGFLQFASPTVVFLMGLFVFGEDLRPAQLACFVMIWAAAGLFTWDMVRGNGKPPVGDEAASRGAAS